MTWITADFGPDYAGLGSVGVAQLGASGTAVVARSTAGIVPMGNGVYAVDAVIDGAAVLLQWDTGTGVYASEDVPGAAGGGPSAATIAAAVRVELASELASLLRSEKILKNRMITDPATGTLTIYDDDDTTVLYSGPIFEDAAGAQPYRGQGAERRERLT